MNTGFYTLSITRKNKTKYWGKKSHRESKGQKIEKQCTNFFSN